MTDQAGAGLVVSDSFLEGVGIAWECGRISREFYDRIMAMANEIERLRAELGKVQAYVEHGQGSDYAALRGIVNG